MKDNDLSTMMSESQYSIFFKSYMSGTTTDYANNLSKFTAQMEFTAMKLKRFARKLFKL